MKLSQVFAPIALAAALCGSQAQAAGQFSPVSSYLGNGTYIGILDPGATENAFVNNTAIPASSSFIDYWVFDVNPTGNVLANLQFTSINSQFTAFNVTLFSDITGSLTPVTLANAAYTCASQSQVGGAVLCPTGTGMLSSPAQINGTTAPAEFGSAFARSVGFFPAGRYVARVSGTNAAGGNASYSGSIQVNQIPEPGSLALVGLALLGTAAAMRKRKAAASV